MIKIFVTYANSDHAKFDFDYYVNKHIPMVMHLLGDACVAHGVERGAVAIDGVSKPQHLAISWFTFCSLESFQTAFAQHAPTILADTVNFTNLQPVIQINTILV